MSLHTTEGRWVHRRWLPGLLFAAAIAAMASPAHASDGFSYNGEPVHPACIHALVMQQEDTAPVVTAVSLEGCSTGQRAKNPAHYEGDIALWQDKAILGDGSFAYRELGRLDNGIFGLGVRRVLPDGQERVSLAAVDIVKRPMLRSGMVMEVQMLELLAEIWIPDAQVTSLQTMGNVVHFSSGLGPNKVERTVDFTRLGKARKKRR